MLRSRQHKHTRDLAQDPAHRLKYLRVSVGSWHQSLKIESKAT
jgi:hypothetical protein